jgi:hypothetical protein
MTNHHPCVGCRRARRVSSIDYNNIAFSLPTELPFVEGPEATLDRKLNAAREEQQNGATKSPIMVDNAPGGTSSPPDANKHFDLPCSGNGVTQDLTAFLSATLN